jgi:hypothetical protein
MSLEKKSVKLKFASTTTKLWLYVICAGMTALISDLSHYTCEDSGFRAITPVKMCVIVLNLVLQGVIAWRAFIDDSSLDKEANDMFREKRLLESKIENHTH